MTYHNAVTYVHMLLQQHLRADDVVVDATAGNGHDARFMLGLVGARGTLYAFDVQAEAIAATRLAIGDLPGSVNLIHAGHESMSDHIAADHRGRVRAVTFNLGYLPGGDHALTTTVASTLAAVKSAMAVVDVQGTRAAGTPGACNRTRPAIMGCDGDDVFEPAREAAAGAHNPETVLTGTKAVILLFPTP